MNRSCKTRKRSAVTAQSGRGRPGLRWTFFRRFRRSGDEDIFAPVGVKWLLGFTFWTLIGLSFASQFYICNAKAGLEVTWRQAVSYVLGDWYLFAALSIPVMALERRLPFEAGRFGKSLAAHVTGRVGFLFANLYH